MRSNNYSFINIFTLISSNKISSIINLNNLNDGSKYSISIKGTDFAGNISEILSVEEVTYDISPPELKIELPKSESFVNNLEVSYDVNEPLLIAQMIWIDDKGEKTSFDLKISDLKAGKHVLKDYDIKNSKSIKNKINRIVKIARDLKELKNG